MNDYLMRKLSVTILFFCLTFFTEAQTITPKDSSLFIPMVCSSYSFQLPGGDMAKRFGGNSSVGIQTLFKLKNKLVFGLEGTILFGNKVDEKGILDSITAQGGFIINNDGLLTDPRLTERGFTIVIKGGRLFPVLGHNPNSGLIFIAGVGLLQHKIRIDESDRKTSPQLTKEYKKGYDRLSNGLMLSEYIGYTYLSNNRITNFMIGFEFIQSFTQNRRSFDYDLMKKDTQHRVDLLYGIRFSWVLPLYKKHKKDSFTFY